MGGLGILHPMKNAYGTTTRISAHENRLDGPENDGNEGAKNRGLRFHGFFATLQSKNRNP